MIQMAETNEPITYKRRAKIAFITLATKMNTLNLETSKKLLEALDKAEKSDKVSVVVLKTAGDKIFSAGWDLNMFGKGFSDIMNDFFKYCGNISRTMYFMKKPIIAQVQGSAIGTGATLAFSSDFRYVADKEDLYFRLPEVDIPLFPTTGPSVATFSVLGPVHSKEMLLTGKKAYLKELDKWGAVTKICSLESLEKEVLKFAKRLSRKPALLLQTIKPMFNIFSMDRAKDWYDLENDMADYFFDDWMGKNKLGSLDEFVKKQWKKYTDM